MGSLETIKAIQWQFEKLYPALVVEYVIYLYPFLHRGGDNMGNTWINVYWKNIQKETIKGTYNNEKLQTFGISLTIGPCEDLPRLVTICFQNFFFIPQSMWLKNIGLWCCLDHLILFSWKTQVLENLDFLRLIETDF